MATVKTGGKECEEETLQTAFKKLRVDAESSGTTVHVCEALASRKGPRISTDGGKPKITSPKENWLGCTRKSPRGLVRSQRRRRSKSPILHPPKFTYCSSKMSTPPVHLKHKSTPELETSGASLGILAKKELLPSGPCSVFGVAGYDTPVTVALEKRSSPLLRTGTPSDDESSSEGGSCPGKECSQALSEETGAAATVLSDFKSLCELQENAHCSCCQGECQCSAWQGVEVYSFTGLRDVISECERKLPGPPDVTQNSRTGSNSGAVPGASTSPRSCSEQARVYVDDITIEDLSGYMEYYLYIPKKMSHMAEMMYT
ncbi:oxidative stress-responsive serine-rich protein 1 [Astyanax mexicanus]|uniref:Oxidative stress-responsive serine-rich protein 1 n=2 Tax=Astyanax mexicanus TaxID=7994 RepID=W5LFK3_ASTMX|nr:oxidative stress-responsive serine-rich protein 1 [Astyanax mexicanus]KAG9277698.1 oxidative stress-responsive serine-rich protein 1 [Astyanax mexicanus]